MIASRCPLILDTLMTTSIAAARAVAASGTAHGVVVCASRVKLNLELTSARNPGLLGFKELFLVVAFIIAFVLCFGGSVVLFLG